MILKETTYTRSRRRDSHDTYAPYVIRPAVRFYDDESLFESVGPLVTFLGAVAVVALFVQAFRGWHPWH